MVELRHLRYFLAVAEHCSFTLAAKRLYVSQPTLSQQIRDLERELGAVLLHRGPDGTHLSKVGEFFYHRAKAVLAAVDEAVSEVQQLASAETVLRIGVCYPLPDDLHAVVINAFTAAFPHVRPLLTEVRLPDYVSPLARGELDVALLYPPLDPNVLVWEELVTEARGLVVPRGHDFWEVDEIDVADFLTEPLPSIDARVPVEIRDFWTLRPRRNGESPDSAGEPVATPTELMLTVGLRKLVCPAPWAYRHAAPGPDMKTLKLTGAPGVTVVAARRAVDNRPLSSAFCSLAAATVRGLNLDAVRHRARG